MRHPDHDFLDPQRAAALDDLLHRGDQRLAAVKAEALGAHVFHMQELLEPLGLDQLVEDRAAAFAGELDLLAVALDPLLEPAGLLGVRDVHELQRKGAAIGALHQIDDLAHRRDLKAEDVVDEDRPVHVGGGEAVAFGVQLAMVGHLAHPERVEIGVKVAADPVGADQHDRADAVQHRPSHLFVRQAHALFLGLGGDLVAGGPDLGLGHARPFAGQRRGRLVPGLGRPVGALPACPAHLARDGGLVIAEAAEERVPGLIDGRGVPDPLAIELFDIGRIVALQEARVAEGCVGGLIGHGDRPVAGRHARAAGDGAGRPGLAG